MSVLRARERLQIRLLPKILERALSSIFLFIGLFVLQTAVRRRRRRRNLFATNNNNIKQEEHNIKVSS